MNNRILILTDQAAGGVIDWSTVGVVVTELSELYQMVKEAKFELCLYDSDRSEITRPVAMRLHRHNDNMDLRAIVQDERELESLDEYIDGAIIRGADSEGIKRQIKQILADKRLLTEFGIVGRSSKMKAIARTIDRIGPAEVPVLVVGPSGSGKELIARAIHDSSSRADRPYVAINCGALAEGILESELFGHEKGAFTGSVARREGLFHKADGGTLFLDELGEMSPGTQVKLLRVLEDGTYYPVGSSTPRRANVRIVAATNRDLSEAIADKRFREDLYFRIGVVKITLPSLMDRRYDIQPILHHFLRAAPGLSYSDSALEMLMSYDWPGNVRQLRNFAQRMVALRKKGLIDDNDVNRFLAEQYVTSKHLPVSTGKTIEEAGNELIYRAILSLGSEIKMLRDLIVANLPSEHLDPVSTAMDDVVTSSTMDEMEKEMIKKTLRDTGGNRKEAARRLGIGERTLYRKLNKYALD